MGPRLRLRGRRRGRVEEGQRASVFGGGDGRVHPFVNSGIKRKKRPQVGELRVQKRTDLSAITQSWEWATAATQSGGARQGALVRRGLRRKEKRKIRWVA
ncbi:hypothetical protein PR202_ga12858 [Eleusine coracana subsp. coracana]|uniref:Uncharacterized protein n=1 Tax=Eleusine coracana subsp. coracana TaxID=191504 RepID=A0AAV5CCM2_ELECO|nr:hypothetical protein PR202_ga12858 [Eleusine coracana subsp. coracana]